MLNNKIFQTTVSFIISFLIINCFILSSSFAYGLSQFFDKETVIQIFYWTLYSICFSVSAYFFTPIVSDILFQKSVQKANIQSNK